MKIFVRIFGLLGVILGLVMSIFSFTTDLSLHLTSYEIKNELIDEKLNGTKIVQLSDYHNHGLYYKNGYLPDMINEASPDMIMITGDFIDQYTTSKSIKNIKELFDSIKNIPTYVITGNHEYYARYKDEYFALLDSYDNITYLYDSYVKVFLKGTSLNIAGIHDPYLEEKDYISTYKDDIRIMEPYISNLRTEMDDEFNILLSHRPSMATLFDKYNFDLTLSGHTHGGQVSFMTAKKETDGTPHYSSGYYKIGNTSLIVSNGIGSSGKLPIRVNCPMQLNLITLVSK